ncbi:U-box domain-containing protein 38 [Forsythia ovata]|uniref:U-box domain-containing protein 38 n=1 Tax=Forsythia ovata TaxID=205694 RepID=A0ABD1VJN4_9LAMI
MALCHLTLVQSNRAKIIKLGAVGSLLGLLKDPAVAAWVVLEVVNLAASAEGQSALLDTNAVECLVGMLRIGNESGSGSTRENCADCQGVARGGGEWKLARNGEGKDDFDDLKRIG